MHCEDLENFETVTEWFDELGIIDNEKQNSKRNHLHALKKYVAFTGMNPDELIAEADNEQDSIAKYKNRKIKKYLTDFRNFLTSEGYSPNYVRLNLYSITSFYKNHEINILSKKGEKARPLAVNNKQLTKEIIVDVLNKSSIKQRAIILAIVSSGLSSIDLRHLPLKTYQDGYNPETEVCTLYLRRHKSEVDFVTFFNQEATRMIELYLKDRQVESEYLFCTSDGIQYDVQAFCKIFRDLSKRCEIHSINEFNIFRAHNLRKLFKQTLQNKNVNNQMIEMWMGHDLGGVGDAYSRYSPAQLETYMSVMHLLYIEKQMDVTSTPEYIELEKKAKQLEIEAEKNKVERYEHESVKKQLTKIQQQMILKGWGLDKKEKHEAIEEMEAERYS
jgi:integrase